MNEQQQERGGTGSMLRDPRFAVALLAVGVVVFLGGLGVFGGGPTKPAIQQPFVDGLDETLFGRPGGSDDGVIDRDLLAIYGSADANGEHGDPFSRQK